MGKNLSLRAKTKASLKPELKIKAVWNTCGKGFGGELKSGYENISPKVHSKTSKIHSRLEKLT